jgi:hypothetical protein
MLAKLPLLALFPCLLLLSACRPSLSRLTSPTPAMPSFTATTYAAGDRATSAASGDAVVVTVTSATGIGALDLTWPPDAAPAALTLHMQLHGLEELRLESASSAPASVTAGVLSRPPYAVVESAAVAGQPEAPITPDSPYWAAITLAPVSGDATIPLADGHFTVQVPAQLLTDARGELTVRWIDFYR